MAQSSIGAPAIDFGDFAAQKQRRSRASRLLRLSAQKPLATAALVLLVAIGVACVLAPVIAPYGWDELFTGEKLAGPTREGSHYFGTDQTGRDIFSRVLYGGRLTLMTSFAATIGAITLATLLGVVSGYVLGLYDLVFQRVSDGIQALPGLVILMVVAAVFEQSRWAVVGALMVLAAPASGRVLRSQTLVLRNQPYVEAARVIGASHLRILLQHVLPNLVPLIIIVFTVAIGGNMLILTSLAFLGVIEPSTPDWGSMLNIAGQQYLVVAPWMAIFPGAAITLSVLSFNLLGDGLRDVLDPRLRGSR
jgi:peptide/nickel transport system permease protein